LSHNADGTAVHKQIRLTLKKNPKWPIEMPSQLTRQQNKCKMRAVFDKVCLTPNNCQGIAGSQLEAVTLVIRSIDRSKELSTKIKILKLKKFKLFIIHNGIFLFCVCRS